MCHDCSMQDNSMSLQDSAFLSTALLSFPKLAAKLTGQVVLGGHSMGGGTSVMAASPPYSATLDAMSLWAPGASITAVCHDSKGFRIAPLPCLFSLMMAFPQHLNTSSQFSQCGMVKSLNTNPHSNPNQGCMARTQPTQATWRCLCSSRYP